VISDDAGLPPAPSSSDAPAAPNAITVEMTKMKPSSVSPGPPPSGTNKASHPADYAPAQMQQQ
jgi:hypothetical protein